MYKVEDLKAGTTDSPDADRELWTSGIDIKSPDGDGIHHHRIQVYAHTEEQATKERDYILGLLKTYALVTG